MPLRVPEKVQFLNGEIVSLRSRIGATGNAVQMEKMRFLTDIRDDYQASLDRAKQQAEAQE